MLSCNWFSSVILLAIFADFINCKNAMDKVDNMSECHKTYINLCCNYGQYSQSYKPNSNIKYYAGYTTPKVDCYFDKELSMTSFDIRIGSESVESKDVFRNGSYNFRYYEVPYCEFYLVLYSFTLDFKNNHLIFQRVSMDISTEEFCLAHNGTMSYILTCARPFSRDRTRYFPYVMLLQIPLLASVLGFFIFVKDVKDMPLRKPFLCFVFWLMMTYVIHIIVQGLVKTHGVFFISRVLCKLFGVFSYFTYLKSFMWMTIIAFDVWRSYGKEDNSRIMRMSFLQLTLFTTIVSVGFFLVIHFIISVITEPELYEICDVTDMGREIVYLFIPLAICGILNVTFYTMAYKKMRKNPVKFEMETTGELISPKLIWDFRRADFKLMIYGRLFISMASTTALYFFTQIMQFFGGVKYPILVMSNIFSGMQGVLIVLLFIWNPRCRLVLKNMKKNIFKRNR